MFVHHDSAAPFVASWEILFLFGHHWFFYQGWESLKTKMMMWFFGSTIGFMAAIFPKVHHAEYWKLKCVLSLGVNDMETFCLCLLVGVWWSTSEVYGFNTISDIALCHYWWPFYKMAVTAPEKLKCLISQELSDIETLCWCLPIGFWGRRSEIDMLQHN
jgi:hypothetical protein